MRLLLGGALLAAVAAATNVFVLTSSPTTPGIFYTHIGDKGPPVDLDQANYQPLPAKNLGITTLAEPYGIAVYGNKLYVADTKRETITQYNIASGLQGDTLTATNEKIIMGNVQARWIATDMFGDLFYTDEAAGEIRKISSLELLKTTEIRSEVLYSQANKDPVSAPGGIAADNLYLYWTNKLNGQAEGSVVQALEKPPATGTMGASTPLAKNSVTTYGVCLAQSNVFFTDHTTALHGVKKVGGSIAKLSDALKGPRGCSYDRDGTIYIADYNGNGLYSFAGNMRMLQTVGHFTKISAVNTPFGVAVFSDGAASLLGLLPFLVYFFN